MPLQFIFIRIDQILKGMTVQSNEHTQTAKKKNTKCYITKTRIFQYIENFTTKQWKVSNKNSDIFHILLKT